MVRPIAYHILGHSNDYLAIVIDTLLAVHGNEELLVTVVSNIPVNDPTPYQFPASANLHLREIDGPAWDGAAERILPGVPNPRTKRTVVRSFLESHGVTEADYCTLVHPAAVIGRETTLGPGAMVGPGSVVAPYVSLGALTTVSRKASVGHHVTIGTYCDVNPGANIAGKCRIGDRVVIGMGANVLNRIGIGDDAVVGAGAVVTRDVAQGMTVFGVPARVARRAATPA